MTATDKHSRWKHTEDATKLVHSIQTTTLRVPTAKQQLREIRTATARGRRRRQKTEDRMQKKTGD